MNNKFVVPDNFSNYSFIFKIFCEYRMFIIYNISNTNEFKNQLDKLTLRTHQTQISNIAGINRTSLKTLWSDLSIVQVERT